MKNNKKTLFLLTFLVSFFAFSSNFNILSAMKLDEDGSAQEASASLTLLEFPVEILVNIFSYLNIHDLVQVEKTCTTLNMITIDKSLQKQCIQNELGTKSNDILLEKFCNAIKLYKKRKKEFLKKKNIEFEIIKDPAHNYRIRFINSIIDKALMVKDDFLTKILSILKQQNVFDDFINLGIIDFTNYQTIKCFTNARILKTKHNSKGYKNKQNQIINTFNFKDYNILNILIAAKQYTKLKEFIRNLNIKKIKHRINHKDPETGNTPLHTTIITKGTPLKIAELLLGLGHGADINAQNKNGNTPLHLAAKLNLVNGAFSLLNLGADPQILNNNNQKPTDLTENQIIKDIIKAFIYDPTGRTALLKILYY